MNRSQKHNRRRSTQLPQLPQIYPKSHPYRRPPRSRLRSRLNRRRSLLRRLEARLGQNERCDPSCRSRLFHPELCAHGLDMAGREGCRVQRNERRDDGIQSHFSIGCMETDKVVCRSQSLRLRRNIRLSTILPSHSKMRIVKQYP